MEKNSCVVELRGVSVYHTDGERRSPKREDELVLSDVNLRGNVGEMRYSRNNPPLLVRQLSPS